MWIILSLIAVIAIGVYIFIHQASFGRTPEGQRLERVKASPNYRDGAFQNLHETQQLTQSFFKNLSTFSSNKQQTSPKTEIPSVKTNLFDLDPNSDVLVWFGHSSYYFQISGKRFLVDPVFSRAASPVSFFAKSFKGSDVYHAADIPDIDYLVITHDHWDHLDYNTVKELKPRIGKIVCPLGVGEHFERWGFDAERIVEMDWNKTATLDSGFEMYCLPARHFSGRGLSPKQSLWASFLLQTPAFKIYMGGDSGYDTHFAEIGERFGTIDLALIENGQYGDGWKYIHMQPEQTLQAAKDLRAMKVIPVHNSKFSLALHSWDEPMQRLAKLYDKSNKDFTLLTPMIGDPVYLNDSVLEFKRWWETIE